MINLWQQKDLEQTLNFSEFTDFRDRNSVIAPDLRNFAQVRPRNPDTVPELIELEIPKPFCDPHTEPQLSYGPGTQQFCGSPVPQLSYGTGSKELRIRVLVPTHLWSPLLFVLCLLACGPLGAEVESLDCWCLVAWSSSWELVGFETILWHTQK